ncbi:uracil phosphoribosyltransferase [Rhodovibrio sodomensis]|uniref:Uracil phosphoribosyltransferase n=1 Tax=Rhodovibrio sodomensis TaxID=1088 RepID=A0ABS1DGG6_9PROT|nr:uracil phosphoribosyltransferase [Rhodovibrio sodomensis]MBK1668480.1 uracil phosphoribosyltransferase [Rhodovibrio sodomensis]
MPDIVAGRDITVVEHPLVQHKLTQMRRRETPTPEFRRLARELSLLLAYEVTRDIPLDTVAIDTPVAPMNAPEVAGRKLCLVSILRAGNGILEGMLDLIPHARVGHVGLYRDPETLRPVEYYFKVPELLEDRLTIVCDPMLATGHTAAAAVTKLKQRGAANIKFLCLLAAPEGVEVLKDAHDDVPIFAAALDERLNDDGFIVPGLGDAGDRIYGTA